MRNWMDRTGCNEFVIARNRTNQIDRNAISGEAGHPTDQRQFYRGNLAVHGPTGGSGREKFHKRHGVGAQGQSIQPSSF